MNNQWYLGVETSTNIGSLALVNKSNKEQWIERTWDRGQSHSEVITNFAEEIFIEAGISTGELTGIVSGCGPGSFTGIRVALNFAKSLAYANQLPLWTVTSLESLAFQAQSTHSQILVGCEAFRDLIYVAIYQDDGLELVEVMPPRAVTSKQVCDLITCPTQVAGNGLFLYWNELQTIHKYLQKTPFETPTARSMLESTVLALSPDNPKDWKSAKPLYIRASEAEEKLRSGELKPQRPRF